MAECLADGGPCVPPAYADGGGGVNPCDPFEQSWALGFGGGLNGPVDLACFLSVAPAAGVSTIGDASGPECPLEGLTGNFKPDPNSKNPIHAIFAPAMAAALDKAIASLNKQGIVPMITSGFRTKTENDSNRNSPNGNSRVSNHLVGMAIDVNTKDGSFAAIKAAFEGAGLTWGGTFGHPDRPHFQLPAANHNPSAEQIAACDREHPGGR